MRFCIVFDMTTEDFVKSRFGAIQFTVIFAGLKNIVRYTEDFVKSRFVKSRFHCTYIND